MLRIRGDSFGRNKKAQFQALFTSLSPRKRAAFPLSLQGVLAVSQGSKECGI